MPAGRKPMHPNEKTISVGVTLTESEVKKLDYLAAMLRHSRSGVAALLLTREINREYTSTSEKNGAF